MFPRRIIPALLTRTSICPRKEKTFAINSVHSFSFEISAGIATAAPPLEFISDATFSAFTELVSVTTTKAPSPARR